MNFRFEFLDPKTYYKLSSKLSESVKIKKLVFDWFDIQTNKHFCVLDPLFQKRE